MRDAGRPEAWRPELLPLRAATALQLWAWSSPLRTVSVPLAALSSCAKATRGPCSLPHPTPARCLCVWFQL